MELKFRPLRADEVECRVAQTANKTDKDPMAWITALLYKNARCDMSVLDETVGPMNWQRHHLRETQTALFPSGTIRRRSGSRTEDTGTESNAEAEKGLASDSLEKRAGFNWGIGRGNRYRPRRSSSSRTSARTAKRTSHCASPAESFTPS